MQIIIQISAWVVLAVGFFAVGHKFFPNFKKWLTTGKVSYVWLIAITLGLFVLLTYPYFFNWWAINFWGVPKEELSDLTKLGPLGDIYGSLNTLISSIALCAVAYSTYLQIKELRLSRQTYEDQLRESKYSNFTSLFYSLFNNKNLNYNNLIVKKDGVKYGADEIFLKNGREIIRLIIYEWKGEIPDKGTVRKKYIEFNRDAFGPFLNSQLISYFSIYGDLFYLINNSDLLEKDNEFFKRLVTNSMSTYEQLCLLWAGAFNKNINENLKNSAIFKMGYRPEILKFMKKFYDKSYLSNPETIEKWSS